MTQEQMNLNFLGTPYNLGERYTVSYGVNVKQLSVLPVCSPCRQRKDLTKVLFVCFFYSALFPASFLFGFAILFVQYHVDKFCLLRIWGFSPSLGSSLAKYSRRYFFTGATVAFIISSSYAWAQFRKLLCEVPSLRPWSQCLTLSVVSNLAMISANDNVCDPTGGDITRAEIPYSVYLLNETESSNGEIDPVNVLVEQEEPVYYCPQGFRQQSGFAFPMTPDDQPEGLRWMTDSQVRSSRSGRKSVPYCHSSTCFPQPRNMW